MMNTLQFQKKLLGMQDNMCSFALSLTANMADAEDLMQDTSLRVLNNRDKFKDNVNFKGWVLTVMRNIFINNYHRLARTQAVIDSSADPYNVPAYGNVESATPESAMTINEITDSIEMLPNNLREPFSMHISGYKYNEIADELGLPLGTVKSRIFLARQSLQKTLSDFIAQKTEPKDV